MKAFIITIGVCALVEIICSLYALGTGNVPPRTSGQIASNAVLWLAVAAWAAYLIWRP